LAWLECANARHEALQAHGYERFALLAVFLSNTFKAIVYTVKKSRSTKLYSRCHRHQQGQRETFVALFG
jgi:hypothetical protein